MKVLVLNAGSSSQKSVLFDIDDATLALPLRPPAPLWDAYIMWRAGEETAMLTVHTSAGASLEEDIPAGSRKQVIETMLRTLWEGPVRVLNSAEEIDVVGHRVVHGGSDYHEAVRVTPEVKAGISRLAEFAPQHNPANLQGIEVCERLFGDVAQVAVFDTAFHAHLPLEAAVYPGPYEWFERGIRRYGFHGISYQYCTGRAAEILGRDPASLRLIVCHLGAGCSMAAIQDGRSVDTTMGFTPLDGLMMNTRSGSVDPGILTYLMRQRGYTAEQLDHTLNRESGIKGIFGKSSDMRDVLAAQAQGDERAALTFDMYVHRLRSYIGAMLAALGGADALIFTAGVGEHIAEVRSAACAPFAFAGIHLDEARNASSSADTDVAAADSAVRVLIVQTQEDWMIARECRRLAEQK
ncbi:MAG: acetate/propionate family kinase [Ktedonobacterales bacterium]